MRIQEDQEAEARLDKGLEIRKEGGTESGGRGSPSSVKESRQRSTRTVSLVVFGAGWTDGIQGLEKESWRWGIFSGLN